MSGPLSFGVVLQTDPPLSRVLELAKRAEANGFSHGWTFDSHVLWQEAFVAYTLMLAATQRMIVGPMVSNPGTRDWTVLASMFATLDQHFGPRTICGMGRGDSALRVIGRTPRSLADTEEAIGVIRGLVAGDEVDYRGTPVRLAWVTEGRHLPVWMAAYGPRMLDMTGRVADGFILQLADPQILAWTLDTVRTAASDAGRDPDSLSVAVVAPAYVGDDLAHQRDQLRWFGGMVGNHVVDLVDRYGEDEAKVPAALSVYIKARRAYDYRHHGKAGSPTTDFVTDEVVDRFCVLGPVDNHIARLQELRDLGVDHFGVYLMHDDQEGTLDAYGSSIIPALGPQ
ncbi:MAG: TIGR03842 family LLM class F420-dependent oxidoreductase [Acidimicrobiia bacterium]|nr:TIGR03842 family LLM class F420-dependent oxidoreductase [Acidimicrobiia bacterium]